MAGADVSAFFKVLCRKFGAIPSFFALIGALADNAEALVPGEVGVPLDWGAIGLVIVSVVFMWIVGAALALFFIFVRWVFGMQMDKTTKFGWKYYFVIGPLWVLGWLVGLGVQVDVGQA